MKKIFFRYLTAYGLGCTLYLAADRCSVICPPESIVDIMEKSPAMGILCATGILVSLSAFPWLLVCVGFCVGMNSAQVFLQKGTLNLLFWIVLQLPFLLLFTRYVEFRKRMLNFFKN